MHKKNLESKSIDQDNLTKNNENLLTSPKYYNTYLNTFNSNN